MISKISLAIKILFIPLLACAFLTCKNTTDQGLSIVLHDKPLDIIRTNVQGDWRLVKVTGGFCPTCPNIIKHSPYMSVSNDRIIFGNDSLGVTIDALIIWKKVLYGEPGDSTFVLGFESINRVVDRIENGTLILVDYTSDTNYLYYEK